MKKRDKVKEKFGGRCAYCGSLLEHDWQVDHKISLMYWSYGKQQGDVQDMANLVPACRICNHYKRSKMVESIGHHIGYRDYMLKFHIRLGKLPKNTEVDRTQRRKVYMQCIADRYNIAADRPWSGVFYMDTYRSAEETLPYTC